MGERRRGEEEDAIDDAPAPEVTRAPPTAPAAEKEKEGKCGGSDGGARGSFPPRHARSLAGGVHLPTAATGAPSYTLRPSQVQRAAAPCRRPRERVPVGWGMAIAIAVAVEVAVLVGALAEAEHRRLRGAGGVQPRRRASGASPLPFPKSFPPFPPRRAGRPTWSPAGRSRRRRPPPRAPKNTVKGARGRSAPAFLVPRHRHPRRPWPSPHRLRTPVLDAHPSVPSLYERLT